MDIEKKKKNQSGPTPRSPPGNLGYWHDRGQMFGQTSRCTATRRSASQNDLPMAADLHLCGMAGPTTSRLRTRRRRSRRKEAEDVLTVNDWRARVGR